MNLLVASFFLYNVVASFFLGIKFFNRKDLVFQNFGGALVLNAVAFAIWLFGIARPENFLASVTVGAIFFLASLIFMLQTITQDAPKSTRRLATLFGIAVALGVFYIGHNDPSLAYISPEGFFFFNLGPLVQMLYIFSLTLTAIPAISIVASKFQTPYAALVRYGLIVEISAGIILITSTNAQVLYLTGWIVGGVYTALCGVLLFNRKAWPKEVR